MTPNIRPAEVPMRAAICAVLLALLSSCTNVPLQQGTSLGSYAGMAASGGSLTKAKLRVNSPAVLAAQTVRIVPTVVENAGGGSFDAKDLALLSNAVDRALCMGLIDRFKAVAPNEPADLVVHATVTDIVATNRAVAATSTVATLGASVAMVPIPRIPIGLGGLSVEAEAVGQDGTQQAAMIWSRGANMLTTKARISSVGDAYSLSSAFGVDFSRMLVKGQDPFKETSSIRLMQKIKASFGSDPKYQACKAFGPVPGIKGAVAGQLGLPPSWSDKGATTSQ
ncbi:MULTISPECIES: DUF3313 domain-containing protein [Rhizobium]|uniref:DUF3313 domain-containing protein n=1 Tax=Rhizobium indicum TaxID=2583231 RepID=A0ABX6PSP9_9HYPH|nr:MULTISPECIES: DUF3313 domain-containing protein [Rhizobium]NNU68642.1 DUF3313 domain-containing protein [Rhizobium sp. WYCCWR 11152]QKK21681.1 DUF3313 domain-containing protein [Rhizobium indicum]QKK35007.1 DUF3313 domain-containing protein [Rhizobium indicum]